MTRTTIRARTGIAARISAWVRRCQHDLSARTHAAADDCARRYAWTVTETTRRSGFRARSYRDLRFDDRRRQPLPGAGPLGTCSYAAPARQAGE
jgi:hypothetical protein